MKRKNFQKSIKTYGLMLIGLVLSWTLLFGNAFAAGKNQAGSEALYEQARRAYYELFKLPDNQLDRKNWVQAISLFQTVLDRYPSSHQSYKAAFSLGLLYRELFKVSGKNEDQQRALEYFNLVAVRFPVGRLTDDALYHTAKINQDMGEIAEARAVYQTILKKFAHGDQVAATKRELRILSEKKTVRVATKPKKKKKLPSVQLYDLAYQNGKDQARVTLRADGPVSFSQQRLDNPDRLRVSFVNGRWDPKMQNVVTLNPGLLTHVEPRKGEGDQSVLMVEMTGGAPVTVSTKSAGHQFILEFQAIPDQPAHLSESVVPRAPLASEAKEEGRAFIVLDPGHGGKDDGAKGKTGLLEKQVNLDIAKRVKRILEKRYKYKVVLTRTKDTFIELKDRGDFANQLNADLFVSIHANAAERKSARGIETYYLGSGAGDRALETAARENGELVGSVEDDDVQQILASLISTTKINESARLASDVQKRLTKIMPRKFSKVMDLGVKEGPFYVLHRTNMPSILVEVGFLTNVHEERRLKNISYLYWLAESIAQGIQQFVKEKGPSI